ncbi:hypothetical protein F441_09140 [Phytophthora nicotianae CJ01A1]|uniref:Uncharacterized protein n=1 Tax=Phytophthora nicotianae CJ01A1 TaxID=1317063 RepID=W2X0G2_PHYNI|nr:hypothetical protein F441_09140 [Phytophthora nicotianae CJ01A1]
MSGKRNTSARGTLGARKFARVTPLATASSSAEASSTAGEATSSSLHPVVDAASLEQSPLVVSATSVHLDHGATSNRCDADLFEAINAVIGSESESDAAVDFRENVAVAGTEEAVVGTRVEHVVNWTVRKPGKVIPPTCNDYDQWTVVQLRKECTGRKFLLGRKVSRPEQIRRLRAYDAARRAAQSSVDEGYLMESSPRKTKHCMIRLLNILFSDHFAEKLASSDDTATRDQIDAGEVNKKTAFWKEVGVVYRTNTTDFNELFAEAANDPRYEGINPSVIVEHNTAKIYDMWKSVNGKFVKALARFNVSGQNSNEFYDFCDANLEVLYLRVCTGVKPELMDFVSGGMHEEDKIDSLNMPVSEKPVAQVKSSKWQDQVLATINRMVDIFAKTPQSAVALSTSRISRETLDEGLRLGRIAKLQQMTDQVKESQRKMELSGFSDPSLAKSVDLYQQRLQYYESRLADLD